jgi:hypothetical protein
MPLFVCDECNCVENTALGLYYGRHDPDFKDNSKVGKALCSECAPTEWWNGTKTGWGKWHNQFPKRQWDGKQKVLNR